MAIVSKRVSTRCRYRSSLSLRASSVRFRSMAWAKTFAIACKKLMSSWVKVRFLRLCTPNTPKGQSRPSMMTLIPLTTLCSCNKGEPLKRSSVSRSSTMTGSLESKVYPVWYLVSALTVVSPMSFSCQPTPALNNNWSASGSSSKI